jgi:hypothetical protein
VLLFARMAFDRSYLTTNFKEFASDINRIVTDYHTKASSPTIPITKFAVLAVDFLQLLGKHKDASDLLIRIATIYPHTHHIKPLFFEQAAYEYL